MAAQTPELLRQVVSTTGEKLWVANYVWDTNALDWVAMTQPGGGPGGGGAATIADGADVTQGAKADATWDGSSAASVVSILRWCGTKLEAVRALLAGTLTIGGSVSVSNLPASQAVTGPLTDTQLRASAVPVSGTFFQATQPVSLATNTPDIIDRAGRLLGIITAANLDVALSTRLKPADTLAGVTTVGAVTAITNALPAGTNALGKVQEAMPNRVSLNMFAEAVAGSASEAAITMSHSLNNATVATGTSYTPTSGKNLRILAIVISWVATTTTANTCRVRIRVNASGAATLTSPIQYSHRIAWESPTFIANEGEVQPIMIPEGLEVPNGGGIMFTQLCAAANGTLDITVIGYEYTP